MAREYHPRFFRARGPLPASVLGLGQTATRYEPAPSQILDKNPRPGTFYRPRKGILPTTVAQVAYGSADRKRGLLLMNAATWNGHVRKAKTGWEAYGVPGLQFEAHYAPSPARSAYGTGTAFPAIWVPPLDGREPEAVLGAPAPGAPPPAPLPGKDPSTWGPPPISAPKEPAPPTPPDVPPPQPPKPPAPGPGGKPKPPKPGAGSSPGYAPPIDYGKRYQPFPPIPILEKNPKPGTFYRPRKGITPAQVAHVAYGAANRKRGLLLMNGATWNDHVRRAAKYWEAYHVNGLQFEAQYAKTPPRSLYKSGTAFPVIWVPPLDGREPEQMIGKPAPGPVDPAPPTPPDVPPPQPPKYPDEPPFKPYVPPPDPVEPVPPTPPDVPPPGPVEPVPPPGFPDWPDPPPGPVEPAPPTPPDVPPPAPYEPPKPPPSTGDGKGLSTGLVLMALSMAAKALGGDR